MRKFLFLNLVAFFSPATVLAQSRDVPLASDSVAYASVFAGDFSLLLSIVIGVIATFLVLRAAKKLGGGLFGIVLNYIGIGMLFVVLGTLFAVADQWFGGFWPNIISTALFALGYIFMVLGANRLLKGIINT